MEIVTERASKPVTDTCLMFEDGEDGLGLAVEGPAK